MILISYTGECFCLQYLFGPVSHSIIAGRPAACPPLAVLLDPNSSEWVKKEWCYTGNLHKNGPLIVQNLWLLVDSF